MPSRKRPIAKNCQDLWVSEPESDPDSGPCPGPELKINAKLSTIKSIIINFLLENLSPNKPKTTVAPIYGMKKYVIAKPIWLSVNFNSEISSAVMEKGAILLHNRMTLPEKIRRKCQVW